MPSKFHRGGKWIHPAPRLAILLRDNLLCQWCLTPLGGLHPNKVTLDHIIPRESGGPISDPMNLITACKNCNSERGTLGVTAYARVRAFRALSLANPAALDACTVPHPSGATCRMHAHRRHVTGCALCEATRIIVRRIQHARRQRPNLVLAQAILAGETPDPRPIVRRARKTGRSLAPKGSAADLIRRGVLDPRRLGALGAAQSPRSQAVPF